MALTTPSVIKKQIAINVANLSVADAVFLNSVIATFCDPNQNLSADCLRTGLAFLSYGQGGKMQVVHRLDQRFTKN